MNLKNTIKKMTVVMLGGVLFSPFVSNANNVADQGSQAYGNAGTGNHMVTSDQFNNDLDMTDIVMDDDHMTGNSLHNNGSRNSRTNGSRTWDDHHEDNHGNFTAPTRGSSNRDGRSNGSANYHSSGGGMGGMH